VGVIKKESLSHIQGGGDEKGISNTTLHSIARKEIDFNKKLTIKNRKSEKSQKIFLFIFSSKVGWFFDST